MQQLGLIINPHSKLNKRNPELFHKLENIGKNVVLIRSTKTLTELDEAVAFFRSRKVPMLAVCGGDGSLNRCIEAVVKIYGSDTSAYPAIFLLRGGTMNVVANYLHQRGSPISRLRSLVCRLEKSRALTTQAVHLIRVEGHCGFLYADAAAMPVLELFYQNKTGPLGAFWMGCKIFTWGLRRTARFMRMFQPISYQVNLYSPSGSHPTRTFGVRSMLGFCSFLTSLPMHIPLLPKQSAQPGHFHASFLELEPQQLIGRLPSLLFFSFLGKFHRCPELKMVFTEKMMISSEDKIRYTLDGELYTSHSQVLEVRAGPEIRFALL